MRQQVLARALNARGIDSTTGLSPIPISLSEPHESWAPSFNFVPDSLSLPLQARPIHSLSPIASREPRCRSGPHDTKSSWRHHFTGVAVSDSPSRGHSTGTFKTESSMVSVVSSKIAFLPLLLLSAARHFADAHTWLDCIDTDRSKLYDQSASYIFGGAGGNGFCDGYGAGYPGRGDSSIGTEYTHKMLKNEVEAGSPVCEEVGPNTYSDWRKRLSVAAGQTAYFAYLPNGHIVKDKKGVGTQHGVYWTGQVGTSLTSTHDMTQEHLVDGRTMDYDDGNCGESVDYNGNPGGRAGDGKPCIGSFTIPAGTAPGIYKMVWYWTFWLDNQGAYKDQNMAKGYFGAAYSTCFEVEVTSNGGGGEAAPMPATPSCTRTVSEGDAAVGINIATDTSCGSGGLGCIDNICRYCRVTNTDKSAPFVECASIAATAGPGTTSPLAKMEVEKPLFEFSSRGHISLHGDTATS
ncbi:hypothetical protein GQ600_24550 [Phytophthora cactorum]|nr:hypothetical protein GQ600_24550 [Phytophthora cactorum]